MNDPTLLDDLVSCLRSFGEIIIFEDWHAVMEDEPPAEWSRVRTVELRKRINAIGPLLHRAKLQKEESS